MSTSTVPGNLQPAKQGPSSDGFGSRVLRRVLTDRVTLLAILIVALLVAFSALSAADRLNAPFNVSYLSTSLMSLVPVALLALAQMFVIMSGRSGIDLSVGGMVSLAAMLFGWLVGPQQWPVITAVVITLIAAMLMGLLNGYLVSYLGFPPLIATLASSYVFGSMAMLANDRAPFADERIAATNALTRRIELFGDVAVPAHVFTVLLPCILIAWLALAKSRWGKSLYAVGTNDVAAKYATQPVKATRASAYVAAGLLSGVAAIVNVAQFASARPDAGTAGNGMALPAITIAVLGGVAIAGGLGRVGGTALAALLITWLNAAILISFQGSMGPRVQLLALGLVLLGAVLLNSYANRRYGLAE
ncbi:ABC transporter permease [Brachybacterium sp. JHP9]|uniref:ABC transporter permease n=1 Tax=Brachybacterium equifaecis TaxID=2910770 RepID=A0ABT0R413_9MICO|nr:ABC transporter permease [Brachybacterium equifaecis]